MIKPEEFVHLHCHTEFSMLDGVAQIKPLVNAVKNNGQKAVAITDHGVLHGSYYLWEECTNKGKIARSDLGVKPIVGVEAYITPGTSRHDTAKRFFGGPYGDTFEDKERRRKDVSASGTYTHMTMWATDNEALINLNDMQTIASIERSFGKHARIDRELMEKYSKGVIASSGCVSGAVPTYLRLGLYSEALREAGELQEIYGKDNFYIEIMEHNTAFEKEVNTELFKIAKDIDAKIIATNDLHYVNKGDAIAHDAMLCINSASNLDDPNRFKFDGEGYYVKSTEEMFKVFSDIPYVLTNTLEIAERCNISFLPEMGRFMPHVPIESSAELEKHKKEAEKIIIKDSKQKVSEEILNEGAYFIKEVEEGLKKRFPEGIKKEYQEQADFEIKTILDMGFPSYFLVVSDFVRWAKENDIFVGPGRGSAAGSLVAYALEITDLDPIEHKLIFERFLNPERVSLPDIDIDFEEGGREQVIAYCAQKYGDDKVAQIITFSGIKAKNALRDAARISGFDYQTGDRLSKAFPGGPGSKKTVNGLYKIAIENKKGDDEDKDFLDLFNASDGEGGANFRKATEIATKIEGLTRGWGVHASGVIVSDKKISDVCPVMRRDPGGENDAIITQFEAHACEDLGFVKMDFLGLKNLNTSKRCLKYIEKYKKEKIDLLKIPLDDPKTYQLIANAETTGVFQLDGDGMQALLKRMKPTTFNDISATIALYRPGPMGMNSHNDYADRKNGRKEIEPIHKEVDEDLKEILSDTYGLIVFQEQIQLAARKLADYSLGEADILRRAMGKKIKSELDAQYERFEGGMVKNGYSKAAVKAVWDRFEPFADYAFNRAHSACYGFNAYTNAYMKANYPVEYMAALLTTNDNNHSKLATYLLECEKMGIQVEVPDINKAEIDFTPHENKIYYGFAAVRNVGEGTAEEIIKARETKGEYTSFYDFLEKVPESVLNKRKVESLIKAGAFDRFGETRRALIAIHTEAVDEILVVKRKEATGQFDLFESLTTTEKDDDYSDIQTKIPDLPEFIKKDKLEYEKEMLGRYVSDHPLSGFKKQLSKNSTISIADIKTIESEPLEEGKATIEAEYSVAGMITGITRRISKAGKPWGEINVEDTSGSISLRLFGKAYEQNQGFIIDEAIIKAEIQLKKDAEETNLRVMKLIPLNLSANDEVIETTIRISQMQATPDYISKMKDIIKQYPGRNDVVIEVDLGKGKTKQFKIGDEFQVNPASSFIAAMLEIGAKVK